MMLIQLSQRFACHFASEGFDASDRRLNIEYFKTELRSSRSILTKQREMWLLLPIRRVKKRPRSGKREMAFPQLGIIQNIPLKQRIDCYE